VALGWLGLQFWVELLGISIHEKLMIKSLAAVIAICAFISPASAGVIYTNLTAAHTYSSGGGLTIDTGHDVAQSFVAGISGNLSTIEVAVNANTNLVTNTVFHMVLVNDNSGAPGSVIEGLGNIPASGTGFGGNSFLAVGTSSAHPLLTAGGTEAYWAGNATGDTTHPNARRRGCLELVWRTRLRHSGQQRRRPGTKHLSAVAIRIREHGRGGDGPHEGFPPLAFVGRSPRGWSPAARFAPH
jgi:hypothetical protein